MPALIGRYEYSLDPKNRVVVPPRYRELLSEEKGRHFILSIGADGCLYLFLPSQWETLHSQIRDVIQVKDKAKARAARRHLYSNSHEAPVDEQGRILVPTGLKDHAGMKRDVVVVGTGTKAEIWDRSRLASKEKSAARMFESLSADLDL
ncbi:MAG: division/cell wall cluster transcriptional repressor MraZ [Elusimicrobia bacterium]|nr:division/cell wall cluster transcriptional repressor MraZ [Elusimicrobiota bacterium]